MPEPDHDERDKRVDAERSLVASEHLFRLLVNSVHEYSIFIIDPAGKIATWNGGARRIKGYAAEEIIGQPYSRFFTAEDQETGKPQRLLKSAEELGSIHDEGWRVRKDGTRFWASVTLTALYDDDRVICGYAKITHDDTSRHEAAESLRRSEERFRLAISALREHAFYMLSRDGVVESWNAGAERLKGYTAQEIIGRNFSVFFSEDDRASGKPGRELELATKMGSFEEEGWRLRKDGSMFWAAVVVTAVHDQTGALQGFVKVTRDETIKHQTSVRLQQALDRARDAESRVSEHARILEKQVEERTKLLTQKTEELHHTNRELEQFALIASHDLKEPLRVVSSYLDLINTRYIDSVADEKIAGYFTHILEANRRMMRLVDSLLEFAATGNGFEASNQVPLQDAVESALKSVGQAVTDSGARIETGELPAVRMDPVHMTRVFQNLIGNAIKYRSSHPLQIRIAAERKDDDWVVSVSDNGVGIEQKDHEKIFKLFQRLPSGESRPGAGIGLATCKKIVEHHGGRIWVDSQQGRGSVFKFTLPAR